MSVYIKNVRKAIQSYWHLHRADFKDRKACAIRLSKEGFEVKGITHRLHLGVASIQHYLREKK